jgi:ankyrin repeat protein
MRAILNQDDQTALTWAANSGHASVVALLLGAKANVNHANKVKHS